MNLKAKVLSGFIWSSAGTLGNGIVSFIVTVILARILTASDFALIALLTIFVAISNVIVDSGFSQAIIRDDNSTDEDLSTVFYFNLGVSLILYTILFFLAPYIAQFYGAPELTLLSRIVFLVIIFNAVIIIQNALLKRDLNFALVEKASVIGSVITGALSIILAFTGFGIWALVVNLTLMPFFRGVFLWKFSKWRPLLIFRYKSIKKYLSFGGFLMLQGLLDVIVTNLNSLLIGKVYTKNDLGYYSQGGKFDYYILTPLNSVLDKVIYPIFSKLKKNPLKLKEGYQQMVEMLFYITLPLMFFVSFNADNIIVFFFGEKWREAGQYLQLMTILGWFQIIHKIFVNLILIKGRTKVMFLFAIIKQSLRLAALLLTINISVYAMALGFVISGIIGSLLYIILGLYFLHYRCTEMIIDNYKTIFSTVLSLFCSIYLPNFIIGNIDLMFLFLIQCVTLVITYVFFSYLFKNRSFYRLLEIIPYFRNKRNI